MSARKADDLLGERAGRQQAVDPDHEQRGDRAHDRQPDRGRQAEEAMVEVAKHGRQHDQDGGGVERAQGMVGHH